MENGVKLHPPGIGPNARSHCRLKAAFRAQPERRLQAAAENEQGSSHFRYGTRLLL